MASCIYLIPKQLSSWRCQGMDCPYLGTINRRKRCLLSLLFLWGLDWLIRTEANLFIWFSRIISFENGRHVLDFDFEKLCSMTLSGDNVYCDLVDGKFFQGRGKDTPAYRAGLKNSKLTDSLMIERENPWFPCSEVMPWRKVTMFGWMQLMARSTASLMAMKLLISLWRLETCQHFFLVVSGMNTSWHWSNLSRTLSTTCTPTLMKRQVIAWLEMLNWRIEAWIRDATNCVPATSNNSWPQQIVCSCSNHSTVPSSYRVSGERSLAESGDMHILKRPFPKEMFLRLRLP